MNTTEIVDNFDDNKLTGWSSLGATLTEKNQQLTVRGYWPGVRTVDIIDTVAVGRLSRSWSVPEGQTMEWRVDLVGMNEPATAAILEPFIPGTGAYALFKGRDFIHLCKPYFAGGLNHAHFFHEKALLPNANLVLALALTRVTPNLILTARVLDKANNNAALYERSVLDTPNVDRTLTQTEMDAASGMHLNTGRDVKAPPWSSGSYVNLDVWQYNYDGKQAAAEVTFDNREVRTYEVPQVGIERPVSLSWPPSATINYAVEGASTVQGPWLPIQELPLPGMQQVTLPLSSTYSSSACAGRRE